MKQLHIVILLFVFFTTSAQADEVCLNSLENAKQLLQKIKKSIAEKRDIHVELNKLEKIQQNSKACHLDKELRLTDNQMASFRKYRYAPDNSYNLDEVKCTEISIDTTNMPKNNNQGLLSWCFAFVTADLISFHEKKAFSAYEIALNHHLKLEGSQKELNNIGGFPDITLDVIINHNQKGLCLEKDFKFDELNWYNVSEMVGNLTASEKNLETINCENKYSEHSLLKEIPHDVLKILDKLSSGKRMAALLDIKCKNREKFENSYEIVKMSIYDPTRNLLNLSETLDDALLQGHPAAIAYSSGLLSKGVNSLGEMDHASTVTGRRFNKSTGQCEYRIKNSWGDKDSAVASSIEFVKGNYWVSRTALIKNTTEVYAIKKKN